jgi:hypothetical protein
MWKRLVALVAVLWLFAAPVAFAGGPTSVLLVDPGKGKTAALYNQDADYNALLDAVGQRPTLPLPAGTPDLHGGPGTSAINITWLTHDVQVWRIDHVFMTEEGGPWIETYESNGVDFIGFDQRGTVHRAANPQALKALLESHLGKPKVTAIPANAPVAVAPAAVVQTTGLHWGSLVTGLAIGALLVVAFQLVRRARAN